MVIKKYRCVICGTQPDQISHHKAHLKSKKHEANKHIRRLQLKSQGLANEIVLSMLDQLETSTFDSQHCFIDNIKVSIDDYITDFETYNSKVPMDVEGRELILCHGKMVKPYFRHQTTSEPQMTEWHKEWQSHFSGYTEKSFCKINESQVRDRRTDVDLNETCVIEFQHSIISKEEVDERKNDYALHNKDIIWVIDGADTIETCKLEHSGRVFLEFVKSVWKYESFTSYPYIFLDIDDYIYKVNPNDVKSHMIDVSNPMSKEEFITALKDGNLMHNDQCKADIPQTRMYIRQMGAGNGKTYSIVQLINTPEFRHYDTFVYLTKQHSARHVILTEILSQKAKGYLEGIWFNPDDISSNEENAPRQNLIRFTSKDGKERRLIIGTFDSFVYSIGDKTCKGVDKFLSMVQSILDKEELNCEKDGTIKYARCKVRLSKKTLLIGDEMQDLHIAYMKSIIKIMLDRYVDFYAVGDTLQSISIEENAFTMLTNDLPVHTERCEPINKCRRFSHPSLVRFVNRMVPFRRFGLPEIDCEGTLHQNNDNVETSPLKVFTGKVVYAKDTDKFKIQEEVQEIMNHYKDEVETYNRQPNDFLIVTLFVHNNPLMEALNIHIRDYWESRNSNEHTYSMYSFFHKSEEGTSIDLSESDDLTRMVSAHSSKGDGRKVVFVIGLTEKGLKRFSGDTGNLVYESLLHVMLTRMKEKLYIRLEEDNTDDIYQRIQNYIGENDDANIGKVKPMFNVPQKVWVGKIRNDTRNFQTCYNTMIQGTQYDIDIEKVLENNRISKIIDMKHHNIRYASMVVLSMLLTVDYEHQNKLYKREGHKGQFYMILKDVLENNIVECETSLDYYNKLVLPEFKSSTIPVYKYRSKGGDYLRYFKLIRKWMKEVQVFVRDFLKGQACVETLDYKRCIVLYHMIEICQRRERANLPISDLYDIVHIFDGRDKTENERYKQNHYETITHVRDVWADVFKKYPTMNFLYQHQVDLDGTTDFKVYTSIPIIGYNETQVLGIYLKPQFNSVNYMDTLLTTIYDTFIIKNVRKIQNYREKDSNKNFNKFFGKAVESCIISADLKSPFYISWQSDDTDVIAVNTDFLKDLLRKEMIEHYKAYCGNVFAFYRYWRDQTKDKEDRISIVKIIDEQQKINQDCARYVTRFLERIGGRVEDMYDMQMSILEKYDDKEFFSQEYNRCLANAVRSFFDTA